MERDLALILAAVLALSVPFMIRVCRESERVAVSTPQRFVKLIGPGLFLKLPMGLGPYAYARVQIGDSGRYIGNGWAMIGGQNLPVRAVQHLDVDEGLRVKDFVNREIVVEAEDKA